MRARWRRHGESNSPEYKTWVGMIGRCYNRASKSYVNYGGRGIRMCPRWRNSYEAFRDDMGRKPSPDLTIERIDNEGGYTCGKCPHCVSRGATANCKWATRLEQAHNKRNVKIETSPQEVQS